MKKCIVMLVLTLALSPAFGSIAFSTGFGGPGLDPNLQDSNSAFTIDGTAHKTNSDDRAYIRTVQSNYNLYDWTYQITYQAPSAEFGNIYIGMGQADPDPTFWNEPSNSILMTMFYLSWHPDGMIVQKRTTGSSVILQEFSQFGSGSTHRAVITKAGDSLVFKLDINNDGTIDYTSDTFSLSTQAPYLNSTNSRLFFGTQGTDILFDNMSVVPEPATLGLLILGGWMGIRRR